MNKDRTRYLYFRVFAICYSLLILTPALINWQGLLEFLSHNYNITTQNFIPIYALDQIYITLDISYPGYLRLLLIFYVFSALWASLRLSRGRTIFEAFKLFTAHIIPKPKNFWGTVSDTVSHEPLPFSTIRIVSEDKNTGERSFVTESISDLYGKYRILLHIKITNKYIIIVKRENYDYYEKELSINTSESLAIFTDIYLFPVQKQSSFLKRFLNNILYGSTSLSIRYLFIIVCLSLIITTRAVLVELTLGTLIYFLLMLFAFFWNGKIYYDMFRKDAKAGKIILEGTNEPLNNITVTLSKGMKKVDVARTTKEGGINFNVDPGTYNLSIDSNARYILPNPSKIIKVEINKAGLLTKNVYLKLAKDIDNNITSTLPNPFT